MKSLDFVRIAALSLFGIGAVLATGSVANAQSWNYDQDHSRTVTRQRGDNHLDRDDRGRQTDSCTVNNYDRDGDRDRDNRNSNVYGSVYGRNRYDNDRDDRNSNVYRSTYGHSRYDNDRDDRYQQGSSGFGTVLRLTLGGRRH